MKIKDSVGNKKIKLILVALMLLLPTGNLAMAQDLPVHNINSGLDYTSIQAAIDAPETTDGHTILIDAGIHYENVIVDKSLTLRGLNRDTTIIDGSGIGNVFSVESSCSVSDLTLRNGKIGLNARGPGISIDIYNCTVINNVDGLHLDYSRADITNNIISYNTRYGIYTAECNFTIMNNDVSNNSNGIGLYASYGGKVKSNTISSNENDGIILGIFSAGVVITDSTIILNNGSGIHVTSSVFTNSIYHNNLTDNTQNAHVDRSLEEGYYIYWDNGYPYGGNYWSDHGVSAGSDDIVYTPYIIDADNIDHYPLINQDCWLSSSPDATTCDSSSVLSKIFATFSKIKNKLLEEF